MSALVKNQWPMRSKIFSGSPKKNAACGSFSNMNGGISPGLVSTCQTTKMSSSSPSCQTRRLRVFGLMAFHMTSGRELLPVALQHLFTQGGPDRLVQLDETRRRAHLRHIARAHEVYREFADR